MRPPSPPQVPPGLTPAARDALYRDCALAIDAVGRERESLFLARLALLLMEELGDEARCRRALEAAAHEVPAPSLSRG